MSGKREELQASLYQYSKDTLTYILQVRGFCEVSFEWMDKREKELMKMSRKLIEPELAQVLKDTLEGLEELDCLLEAVEKLAVTSQHVFTDDQVLHLPEGIGLDYVQAVLIAARLVCPRLLEFKRDARVFFLPKLQNVEVLAYQLDRYIKTSKIICEKMEKSCFSDSCFKAEEIEIDLDTGLCEHDLQKMLDHINQLHEIRLVEHFRTAFLFQKKTCCGFINEFTERQPRMLKFLENLEEDAVQLERMNTGSKISSVVGSSVGAVGGVLSIMGLVLIPFTAGLSLALTMTGVGLGITSGVNGIVTTATEIGVNHKYQKKAGEDLQSFMEDVESLQKCLDEVMQQPTGNLQPSELDVLEVVDRIFDKAGSVGKGIESLVEAAPAIKLLKNKEITKSAGTVVAQEGKVLGNVPRVASDIPEIGQAVVKAPLAISKGARFGLIGLNALFLGMDIFYICKDSISLARGSGTEASEFIRARAALWCSEMDRWEKICNSLCQSKLTKEENEAMLEKPFYPGKGMLR